MSIQELCRARRLEAERLRAIHPFDSIFLRTKGGIVVEVPIDVAATKLLDASARLATPEEISEWAEQQAAARNKILAAEDNRSSKTIVYRPQAKNSGGTCGRD